MPHKYVRTTTECFCAKREKNLREKNIFHRYTSNGNASFGSAKLQIDLKKNYSFVVVL